jgi:hypothetical protein
MTALFTAAEFRTHEGFADDPPTDAQIDELILEWQAFIEAATGQFFDERELEYHLDGSGSDLLQLPVPIISIEWIKINESTENLPDDEFAVYAGRQTPNDDRSNPRVKLKPHRPTIFSDPEYYSGRGPIGTRRTFVQGSLNQKVKGKFGYLEPDDSTPPLILKALRRLVLRDSVRISEGGYPSGGSGGAGGTGTKIEEWTDGHKIKWADPGVAPVTANSTGDAEVDRILKMYRKPFAMGGARVWSGQI